MNKKSNLVENLVIFAIGFVITIMVVGVFGSTTFTKSTNSYYGRQSDVSKYVAVITPVANDANTIHSTATTDDAIYGDLRRITIAAAGTDTAFTVALKDSDAVTLFSKSNCSTASLPASYNLRMDANSPGILVAGPLTVDTNNVDNSNITNITVTLYYLESRY